jgi:hypothetical protein
VQWNAGLLGHRNAAGRQHWSGLLLLWHLKQTSGVRTFIFMFAVNWFLFTVININEQAPLLRVWQYASTFFSLQSPFHDNGTLGFKFTNAIYIQGSAQDCWMPTFFSTKFKQIMPFCLISWSDSKLFRLSGGQGQNSV